jgi:uncharacterized protein (TIGR03083 family)
MSDEAQPTPDALDTDDETAIELHLLATPRSAGWEAVLRDPAGPDAASGVEEDEPPPGLLDRILSKALEARPAGQPVDATGFDDLPSPVETHRIEQQRALLYLQGLRPDDWQRPVDPPEFAGWTVHDVAAHLAANATLVAATLAVPVPGVPETEDGLETRTAATQARHRTLPPSVAVAEIDAAARAVDRAVAGLDETGLDEQISWLGVPMEIGWVLTQRAFETWTHIDDIRRAVGDEMRPPPVGSLRMMTRAACGLIPLMLAVRGEDHAGKTVRVGFTDLTDAWDVDLGDFGGPQPAGGDPVDAELTLAAVDLCRGLGARVPEGGLAYTSTGDAGLAHAVVEAVPALATL